MNTDSNSKTETVFVVLHYITANDTIDCVASIQKHAPSAKIIIVDNCSPNDSFLYLKQKYANDASIILLRNEQNLGFAQGNNVGFKYAKKHFNPKFIILCNNDTQLTQDNFEETIKSIYSKTGFAVLGPREQLANGTYYPPTTSIPTIKQLKKYFKSLKVMLAHPTIWKLKKWAKNALRRPFDYVHKKKLVNTPHKNAVLHGAFLIFSMKYIDQFDGLDNRTFLYGEEILLALRLRGANLVSIYDPTITILHRHHSSTNTITKNFAKRTRVRAKHEIESTQLVLDELQKQQES